MKIVRDRKAKKIERLHMKDVKLFSTLVANHFKLSSRLPPTRREEKKEMTFIPYFSILLGLFLRDRKTKEDKGDKFERFLICSILG